MHRLVLSTYLVFLLSLFTTWTTDAGATETFEQIRDDFRTISGMVVKRVGEEFLINLDVSQGLSEGDLFAERLVVRGVKGQVLHQYGHPLSEAKAGDSPDCQANREAVAAQRPDVKGSPREFTTLGTLPGAVLMGAFLENEGRLLLAATSGSDIRVYELTAVPTLVAVGEPTIPGRILSLHWWRPAGDGPLCLALTTEVDENTAYSPVAGKRVAGGIFQLAQDKLTPVREGLSFMLATFDRNGDGEPETLLAQEIDRDIFFGHRVRELLLKKGKIEAAQPKFTLPSSFPVQGSQFADLTGDGRLETIFVRDRTLYVYQGKKRLYQSTRPVGGSRLVLTHDRNPGAKDRLFTTIPFEIPPAIAPVPGEGRAKLMLAVQENAFFGGFGLGSAGGRNALASLSYEKGRYILEESGLEIEGSIQGLAIVRGRILLVVAEPGGSGGADGKGHLLTTPW